MPETVPGVYFLRIGIGGSHGLLGALGPKPPQPGPRPAFRSRLVHAVLVQVQWVTYDEHKEIDTNFTLVVIEMSYEHMKGCCYQIRGYCVYDWEVTVRTGTVRYLLRVRSAELLRAELFAMQFLLDATQNAIANYHDPTSGVAGGLIDIGLMAADSVIPPVFGDLASAKDMSGQGAA